MRAEIVSVGTEILLGQIVDTNAAELGKEFAACGVDHLHRQTVGDNLQRLIDALRTALERSDIVVTIGGLGPTEDDLTREGISEAIGQPLVHDPEIERHLKQIFESRRLKWLNVQVRQAMRPATAQVLQNPHGTAPGLLCTDGAKTIIAMPGPRAEFVPMLENQVRPVLMKLGGGGIVLSRVLRIVGLGESLVEDKLKDLMAASDPTIAPYAKTGEVHIRLTTKAGSQSEGDLKLDPLELKVRRRLGDAIYGSGDQTLEAAVIELFKERRSTIATAESCTGGWLGQRLTSVPGSSDVFVGGVVSYSNLLKAKLLGVNQSTLDTFGAVSAECAEEMALGAVGLGADFGVSITGIAGPGGGTEGRPVGLVHIAVAGPNGVTGTRHQFPGTRDTVRLRSTQMALVMLREALLS